MYDMTRQRCTRSGHKICYRVNDCDVICLQWPLLCVTISHLVTSFYMLGYMFHSYKGVATLSLAHVGYPLFTSAIVVDAG